MNKIYYVEGYKYQLKKDYIFETGIKRDCIAETEYLRLDEKGTLTVKAGYAWNGCSGPTIDDKTNMRACLIHDNLYQMIRLGLLEMSYRKKADKILLRVAIDDSKSYGNNMLLAMRYNLWYDALRAFGESSALPESEPEILEAP